MYKNMNEPIFSISFMFHEEESPIAHFHALTTFVTWDLQVNIYLLASFITDININLCKHIIEPPCIQKK